MVVVVLMVMVMAVVMMSTLRADLLCLQLLQHMSQGVLLLHSRQNLSPCQLGPGCGDNHRIGVFLSQKRHRRRQFILCHAVGAAEHNTAGMGNLVVIELAEILHIYAALSSIRHGDKAVKHHILTGHLLHSTNYIAELTHTRRLNKNAVRSKLLQHPPQSLGKIPHQATANAPGVHFGDFHPGLLEKTAINADFTKLVFNQHQLFPGIGLGNQLFNQRGLARA